LEKSTSYEAPHYAIYDLKLLHILTKVICRSNWLRYREKRLFIAKWKTARVEVANENIVTVRSTT
jgi:hypothetical protein